MQNLRATRYRVHRNHGGNDETSDTLYDGAGFCGFPGARSVRHREQSTQPLGRWIYDQAVLVALAKVRPRYGSDRRCLIAPAADPRSTITEQFRWGAMSAAHTPLATSPSAVARLFSQVRVPSHTSYPRGARQWKGKPLNYRGGSLPPRVLVRLRPGPVSGQPAARPQCRPATTG